MAQVFEPELQNAMLAAADAAETDRVSARLSFVRQHMILTSIRPGWVQAGARLAMLRCALPWCVELWVVADGDIPNDWQAG